MSANLTLHEVDLAIDQFDLHVHQCSMCLVQGNLLCSEGRYIAEDVAGLQAAIRRPMRGPHPVFGLTVRQALAELVA
ncbi:MAG: hypothetical protein L3J96_07885 [Thermoplasmata archaeon]|nr:hypothetical protein [Thermoplasmata archaeon]